MKTFETEEQYLEELTQYIRKELFPHEQKELDEGLALLKISFIEYFYLGEPLFNGDEFPFLTSNELPEKFSKLKLKKNVFQLTEEEEEVFEKFSNLTMKFPKIIQDFISKNFSSGLAIEYSKNVLQCTEILYDRFEEDLDADKVEKHIVKRKRQIADLEELNRKEKNKEKKLIWNNIYDLSKFSIELKEKEIISNHIEFVNIFANQSSCILRKEKVDFFVVLMYELIKKKPSVILTGKDSSRGVLTIIDTLFRDETTIITKTISFTKRHNRICLNGPNYDKIKEKVDLFLKNHLHKV